MKFFLSLLLLLSASMAYPDQQPDSQSTPAVANPEAQKVNQATPPPSTPPAAAVVDIPALDKLTSEKNTALQTALAIKPPEEQQEINPEELKALTDALLKVKVTCQRKFDDFRHERNQRAGLSVWIAIAGTIAGAVVAPAILAGAGSKVAASVFSGISGGTNSAQKVIGEQGLTADAPRAASAQVREQVQKALNEYVEAYQSDVTAAKKIRKMQGALMKADNACFLGEY